MLLEIDWFFQHVDWLHVLSIPVFTGVIGWLINWTGLVMLFSPVRFHGITVPGMRQLSRVLPRKVQEVPGFLQGGIGWQGIVPARAAKMGSIAVDKAIAKLGTPKEFYQQLEPDQIAEHIVQVFEPEMPGDGRDDHAARAPEPVADLPARGQAAVIARVQAQLPGVVRTVTDEIGEHIDQLLDPKIMVINHFQSNPALVVRIFRDFGQRELNLMVAFGFVFGFVLGIPVAIVDHWFGQWWLLPVLGVIVGWVDQRPGHVADLRAAGGEAHPRHQGARAVPAPPGRGRRGLRPDHRRRRDHPGEHRRLPARRPARGPHPPDARRGDEAGHRQRRRTGRAAPSGSRSAADASTTSATPSRMLSKWRLPTAIRTAPRTGPAAWSIAGRIASASIWRVRSPRGPSSRKSPMFSRVITSSAMIRA